MKELIGFISEGSVNGMLSAISIILALQLFFRVGEFLWKIVKDKHAITDTTMKKLTTAVYENTDTLKHLEGEIRRLESALSELPKLKTDMRRLFNAAKIMAGPDWSEIRDEIMKDY